MYLPLVEEAIVSHLDWMDVARLCGAIGYNIWDLITSEQNQLFRQIFVHNTRPHLGANVTKYFKVSCPGIERLKTLNPVQLAKEAQEFFKFPRYNRFEINHASRTWNITQLVFHPFDPICVVATCTRMIYVVAYDSSHSSKIRHPSGILFSYSGLVESDDFGGGTAVSPSEIVWSPNGDYFSFWHVMAAAEDWPTEPEPHYDLPDAMLWTQKQLHLFSYNSRTSVVKKVVLRGFDCSPTESSKMFLRFDWSNFMWSGDHQFFVMDLDKSLKKIMLTRSQLYSVQTVDSNLIKSIRNLHENSLISPREIKAYGFIAVPGCSDLLFYTSMCVVKEKCRHYHHRLNVYSIADRRTTDIFNIPGILQDVRVDGKRKKLLLSFKVFRTHRWLLYGEEKAELVLTTTEGLNYVNCPFTMDLLLNPEEAESRIYSGWMGADRVVVEIDAQTKTVKNLTPFG